MTIAQVVSYIVSGIGIVSFLGAAASFTRGSAAKGTITSLNESVAALQVADGVKTAQIKDLTSRLASAEAENKLLRGTVTQAKEVANLTEMLADHHKESMSALRAIKTEITK